MPAIGYTTWVQSVLQCLVRLSFLPSVAR